MKAYLDNDIVSAIAKSDFPPAEMTILRKLLTLSDAHRLELVTSSVTGQEIARYKGPQKSGLEQVYASLAKVSLIDDHNVLGFQSSWNRFGGESYPLVEDDATSSALRNMRLDRTDAHHLMVAIRAECPHFITYDKKILNRSSEIQNAFSIKVMRPSELLAELNKTLAPTP
jgi:predicted nucleic acid-binding protein